MPRPDSCVLLLKRVKMNINVLDQDTALLAGSATCQIQESSARLPRMKRPVVHRWLPLVICFAAGLNQLWAQPDPFAGAVMCSSNHTCLRSEGKWSPVTNEVTMSRGITIFTNGTFQVDDGKIRSLTDGQVLCPDGNLVNPDGSTLPVFDHLAMKGGGVTLFRNGDISTLTGSLTLTDGSEIQSDGSYTRPSGRRSRLVDGQLLTFDGSQITELDTITLRDGRVTVFKAGALLGVEPNQTRGMFDGTKVHGDGLVTMPDGSTVQLTDGQMITVPGVVASW